MQSFYYFVKIIKSLFLVIRILATEASTTLELHINYFDQTLKIILTVAHNLLFWRVEFRQRVEPEKSIKRFGIDPGNYPEGNQPIAAIF